MLFWFWFFDEFWLSRGNCQRCVRKVVRMFEGQFIDFPFSEDFCSTCLPFLNFTCSTNGKLMMSKHSVEQQFCIASLHSSLNEQKWQPTFSQLVWLSQGFPHWWHCRTMSSVMCSPKRWSKTKFFPINLLSVFFFDLLVVDDASSNWKTFLKLGVWNKWSFFAANSSSAIHHQIFYFFKIL